MKYTFKPETGLEKFGLLVYNALVENFSRTYFVGGTVRDFLLLKKTKDIDIATSASPAEVAETLKKYFIGYNLGFQNLGVVVAGDGRSSAAIASFRKDLASSSRYPEIKYVKTAKEDSKRRDFTINSLYFSPKQGKILDFYKGLDDLKNKKISFVGKPGERIRQDPLRIIRALRLALDLNFSLDGRAREAIKKHFSLVKQLTQKKTDAEIKKLKNKSNKNIILETLANPKLLDKYF